MNHNITSRLDLPARKCMIQKISKAQQAQNTTSITELHMWTSENQLFSVVWIQGKVKKVFDDGNGFLLDDGTAIAEIVDCRSVPPGCPKPQEGKYMMAVGEVVHVHPHPAMKAMKIQDLTGDSQAQVLWPLEVKDSDRFLSSQQH